MMTELSMTSPLQLPALFVKTSIENIGAAVTLEGPGKGKWRVQIGPSKENHSVEFRDGWHKFVVDHTLQIGDQLSFTLTAGSYFQVLVYDESGSQKVSAIDARNIPDQRNSNGGAAAGQVRPKPVSRPKQKVRRTIEGAAQPVKLVPPLVHSSESEPRNSNTSEKGKKSKETSTVEPQSEDERDTDESHCPLLSKHVIIGGQVISKRRQVGQEEKNQALNAAKACGNIITNPNRVMILKRPMCYGRFHIMSTPFNNHFLTC